MKKNDKPAILPSQQEANEVENDLQGYPLYPDSEDIYKKFKKERNVDPEDVSTFKEHEKIGKRNKKDFNEDMTGEDLDIPGTELDDEEEITGIEDEENDYYSLGGDDHIDLDENLGQ